MLGHFGHFLVIFVILWVIFGYNFWVFVKVFWEFGGGARKPQTNVSVGDEKFIAVIAVILAIFWKLLRLLRYFNCGNFLRKKHCGKIFGHFFLTAPALVAARRQNRRRLF